MIKNVNTITKVRNKTIYKFTKTILNVCFVREFPLWLIVFLAIMAFKYLFFDINWLA